MNRTLFRLPRNLLNLLNPIEPFERFKTSEPSESLEPFEPWEPNNDNGGSTVAIAVTDYAIVDSDTSLYDGVDGISGFVRQNLPKMSILTDQIVLGNTGTWTDVLKLTCSIKTRIRMFKYTHNRTIQMKETSQMLSNMLYARRFFPYPVTNILVS